MRKSYGLTITGVNGPVPRTDLVGMNVSQKRLIELLQCNRQQARSTGRILTFLEPKS
jgi:hypothetical protein